MSDSSMQGNVLQALTDLHQRFYALFEQETPPLPRLVLDEEWLSPCLVSPPEKSDNYMEINWKPVEWGAKNAFDDLEKALEISFHPDIICFYTSFWSDGFWGAFEGNELSLIQVWNEDDLDMLRKNLLGHAFAKKKNKLPLTVFIGCTDDDLVISVDNATGEVGLENPGQKQHHILARSLAEFLTEVEPSVRAYSS